MTGATSPLGFPFPVPGDPMKNLPATVQQLAEALDDYLAALAAVAGHNGSISAVNGWAVTGGGEMPLARRAGFVCIVLNITKASWNGGDLIATLPAGFRPPFRVYGQGEYNGAGRPINIDTDGTLRASMAQTTGIVGSIVYPV